MKVQFHVSVYLTGLLLYPVVDTETASGKPPLLQTGRRQQTEVSSVFWLYSCYSKLSVETPAHKRHTQINVASFENFPVLCESFFIAKSRTWDVKCVIITIANSLLLGHMRRNSSVTPQLLHWPYVENGQSYVSRWFVVYFCHQTKFLELDMFVAKIFTCLRYTHIYSV